jgi:hypothetical protein
MRDRTFLGVLSATMVAGLALFLIDPQPRQTSSDKAAFERIVEQALDSNSPMRFELWRAAREQVARLDPNRPTAATAFVRSGLFHWYELNDADRREVLTAIEPLLRDGPFFDSMARPLFQLTGDFKVFRRANPGSEGMLSRLAVMAAENGRFDDYRYFRERLRRRRFETFAGTRKTATPSELVDALPVPVTAADGDLMQGLLNELHVRPIDDDRAATSRMDALIDYALDHNLQPLDGLEPVLRIPKSASDSRRARLALRLGQLDRATDIENASSNPPPGQWHSYYVERAVAETRRHESLAALQYLEKAGNPSDPLVIAAREEMQRLAGNAAEAARDHAMLVSKADDIEQWLGTCGDDICDQASATLWSDGRPFTMKLTTVQTDEVPPYVEIYADDALMAETAVAQATPFRFDLLPGIRRIEIRIANPTTRNAVHRRLRVE